MRFRSLKILIIPLLIFTFFPSNLRAKDKLKNIKSWICYYQSNLPKETPRYDLYIFDSTYFPNLMPIKAQGSSVIGYISLGEVTATSSYFPKVKNDKLIIDENENWPGAFRINIKNKKWHNFVINVLMPNIIAKGFDGIFIDTIDTAEYLENDKKISGSIKGAVSLIKKIRKKYPDIIIVLNNGLTLTDKVGRYIDAIVVEDIYTLYDFKDKKYQLATPKWTAERLIPIKEFQEKFGKPVLSLDYLRTNQRKMIQKVTNLAKSEGFVPYITDINLKTVFFHP